MIARSWHDNPRLVMERRVRNLLIGDVMIFRGVRIRRVASQTYILRRAGWREKVSGNDALNYTIDLVALMTGTH